MEDFNEFSIDETVQSQYAASPHMRSLIDCFWECLSPDADIDLLYTKMINPETAEGYGLDVWGRIVAAGRSFMAVDETHPYLGFDPISGMENPRLDDFDNAPFWTLVNGKVQLNDVGFRTYIFVKAMINIGNSSMSDLNKMITTLFPQAKIMLLHTSTMTIRLLIRGGFSTVDKAALLALPWLPAGVNLEIYQSETATFGFNGSGLKNFNNSTFTTYSKEDA